MSFSGFSEEDIKKLQNNTLKAELHKTAKIKPQIQQKQNKYLTKTINNDFTLPESAKLFREADKEIIENDANTVISKNSKGNSEDNEIIECNDNTEGIPKENSENLINPKIDLKEFEAKQKLIEEQNRKRKELLVKALADRTKKTQKETEKLNQIKNEFKKLDEVLSTDVKILRKQIDSACLEYNECQKRFDKIEREYLDVKLLLHQKREKKVMLTEHLCAIIEKNEERKAKKLDELLQKLQIQPTDES